MPKVNKNKTARAWMWTAYTEPVPPLPGSVCRYAVWQKEVCPTTGREHYQGYVECNSSVRFTQVQALFDIAGAHCEERLGTPEQAREYCMKEKTRAEGAVPVEIGVWTAKKQGRRTDLSLVKEMMDQGASWKECVQEQFGTCVKYWGNLKKAHELLHPFKKTWRTKLMIFWGPTGTGKSQRALRECRERGSEPFIKSGSTKWWDGYEGQEDVIIDDFGIQVQGKEAILVTDILNWCDGITIRTEVKGTSVPMQAKRIYITSNVHPENWYPYDMAHRAALERRWTQCGDCVEMVNAYVKQEETVEFGTGEQDNPITFV